MNKIMITGALLALLASISMAEIISVNFCDNQPVSRNPMLTSSLAGAPGVRTNNWNNIKSISFTSQVSSLVYDTGATVGGAFKITFTTPRSGSQPTNALSNLGNDALMYSGYNQVWNNQTNQVVLTDIPFSSYDIYIYADTARLNCGGVISMTGQQDYWVKTLGTQLMTTNTGAGYRQITNTTQASAISGPGGSGNYVKYSNLSGSSQTFTLAAKDMGDAVNQRLNLAGFQIVKAGEPVGPHAPPPAPTASLGGSGSFGSGQDVLSWTTVQGSGYVYNVYWSTNLMDGFQPLETNLPDTVQSLTNAVAVPAAFYKIEAR